MKRQVVESFRKTLRIFERALDNQLKNTNCCGGITLAQCHTLLALEELGSCSMNELAQNLGLDKSTVSRTIDGLVKIGLVSREIDTESRRRSMLTPTRQGEKTVESINNENNLFFGEVLSQVPTENRDMVLEGFELLTKAFKNVLQSRSIHC